MEKEKFELILCVVNAGFSTEVMTAARALGAMGGTVLHARGTAKLEAEKVFNIAVNPEKDMVLIAVRSSIKDDILKSLYENVGINKNAQGIIFSLPISDYLGLK